MKTLTASLILEKNKLAGTSPWILLLRVTLDDASVLKLAAYPHDVVFAGETYTRFPMTVEAIGEAADGNIGSLRVSVANVNRTISAYLENNDLLGNAVTVRIVHAAHLASAADKVDFNYRVNRIAVTDEAASFELGHEDLIRIQLPRQRYFRNRCRFVYGDEHCAATRDEFAASTRQTIKDARTAGAAYEKLNGWWIVNGYECDTCDADVTLAGHLTYKNRTGAVKDWWNTAHDAAYVYRLLSGDLDFDTYLITPEWSNNGLRAYLVIQSESDATDWIAWSWAGYEPTLLSDSRMINTTDGVSTASTYGQTWYPYVRITRVGNTYTFYGKLTAGAAWTSITSWVRSDLGDQVRVGFTVAPWSASTPVSTVQWDYFRFPAGGFASCDYTLDGVAGCRSRKNTLNYGGAPAMPVGRLYGI